MQQKFLPAVRPVLLPGLFILLSSCGFSDGFSDSSNTSNSNTQQTASSGSVEAGADAGVNTATGTGPDTAQDNSTSPATDNTANNNEIPQQFNLSANGILGFDDLSEASGLAASRNRQNMLWVIADSGNSPELFAINDDGSEVGRISLSVSNRDWEELAAFTFNGENFLMVADTGDNLRQYSSYPLHIIREPQSGASGALQPLVTLSLTYPDGAHDVEALAVAESDGNLYLVSKDETPGVYAVPLLATLSTLSNNSASIAQQSQPVPVIATRIGNLPAPQQSTTDSFLGMLAGVNLGSVTAMDIDDTRGRIWLLTYRGIYLVQIVGNSTLGQALTSQSTLVSRHSLGQAESLAYSRLQDAVFVTSEGRAATVLKLVSQ